MRTSISILSRWKTVIMGVAALWIYLYHEWLFILDDIPFLEDCEEFVTSIGFCGVDIFLLLSGIGLVYAIQKSSLLTFYLRRIRRVMLPFLLFSFVVAYVEKWSLYTFIKNISGYSFYFEFMYTYLWFVPAIMTFYLFFPLYFYFFNKSSNKLLFTFSSVLVWLVISLLIKDILRPELYGLTNRIPIFITGIYLGWMCQHSSDTLSSSSWFFFIIILISGAVFSYLTIYRKMELLVPTSDCCVPNFCMAIALSFLLAKFFDMIHQQSHFKFLSAALIKFFSFLGKISLEFYCVQEWIAKKIELTSLVELNPLLYNAILFVIVLLCGYTLYIATQGVLLFLNYLKNISLKYLKL